jgi:hypothetical protein
MKSDHDAKISFWPASGSSESASEASRSAKVAYQQVVAWKIVVSTDLVFVEWPILASLSRRSC